MPPFLETFLQRVPLFAKPVRFGWRFSERWGADSCPLMAAAMAFFGLLSVFPLALAGVAILARILAGDTQTLSDFSGFVAAFFPGAAGVGVASEIEKSVRAIAGGPSATTLGVVAVGSLMWSGRAYFDVLATVLDRIAPGTSPRSWWQHQIALWSLILGVGALFLLSMGLSFGLSLAQSLAERLPNLFINRAPQFWDIVGKLSTWALSFAMFFLLYRFTPNRKTPPRRRFVTVSALVALVGWEVAKWAFAHFLGNVTRYEKTYGGVAGVVVTMMWIYFASMIIVAGAEVGATYEDVKTGLKTAAEPTGTGTS